MAASALAMIALTVFVTLALAAVFMALAVAKAPHGYQDETGFHFQAGSTAERERGICSYHAAQVSGVHF